MDMTPHYEALARDIASQTERFLAESNELDQAYRNGTLGEFVDRQLNQGMPTDGDDGTGDVAGEAGGPVVGAEGG